MLARYEIRVAHRLNEEVARVFEGLDVVADGETTVISGDLDQAALHGILERVRMLRLELIEARRLPGTTGRQETGTFSPAPGDPGTRRV